MEAVTKSGFVSVVGRPNAGKSTLLNWLVGERLAMVSHKANATRKRMNIIVMHDKDQIIFVDTPGIHQKEKLINQFMMKEVLRSIGDCDLLIFLAPVTDSTSHYEEFLELSEGKKHILALAKSDTLDREETLKKIKEYEKFQDSYLELVPVSSKKEVGKKELLDCIVKYLPDSPYLFDPEDLTTENLRGIYKEIIREAIFEKLSDEIPYEADVLITKFEELKGLDRIYATIVVEKETQKAMIIGKGGATLKRVGSYAREKMEEFSQKKVYLNLFVSVKRGWSKSKKGLKEFGYKIDD